MPEACMFNIITLPQSDLRRVLPKASAKSLARLAAAYPRAVARTFIEILAQCMSPVTLEFIRDEISATRPPSYPEIRQAEQELMKIIHEEHLGDHVASGAPATALPQ